MPIAKTKLNIKDIHINIFWSKVNKNGAWCEALDSNCWEWTGALQKGYGRTYVDSFTVPAHRFSWTITFGEIENNLLYVCHKCDNRKCVNPDHLFLGTHQDNMDDGVKKERFPRGENSYMRKHIDRVPKGEQVTNSKLKERDILEIRRLYFIEKNITQKELSIKFNVSMGAIEHIILRETWKHLLPKEDEYNDKNSNYRY